MKTKIVSFGDSFVFGSELADNMDGHKSWVGQAAAQLGVEYETLAIPGCGNESITRQILTYFSNNPSDNVLAVINWTWGARWDFYIPGIETWTTLGLSCVPSKLEPLIGLEEAEKVLHVYKKYTGDSMLWEKFKTLQTIHTSQQFLRHLNVPNIQTYMDYEILNTQHHAPDYVRTLQDLTQDSFQNFEGQNFLDWSRNHGFAVTEPWWHPLEQAHEAACSLWLETYRQALTR